MKCNLVLFRIISDRHLRNLARPDSAPISGSKTQYLQIFVTLPFQDSFHHFRMTWLIFCAVKFQYSMFDESSQQCCQLPRARKSKLASGYTLIKIHFTWTCILVLDLCSVHIRCAAHASGLACVSVRCAAARHERRAAVTLQSGGHRASPSARVSSRASPRVFGRSRESELKQDRCYRVVRRAGIHRKRC